MKPLAQEGKLPPRSEVLGLNISLLFVYFKFCLLSLLVCVCAHVGSRGDVACVPQNACGGQRAIFGVVGSLLPTLFGLQSQTEVTKLAMQALLFMESSCWSLNF